MTAPMPETMSPREKVAAVLDPEIWADDMPVPTRAAVTDFHARRKASVIKADAILAALASSGDHAELARLKAAMSKSNDEICQSLGKALGYPWFKDDQRNFPGATEGNGVCVGDHVAESIADEAASRISDLLAENAALRDECDGMVEEVSRSQARLHAATEAERKLAEAVGLLVQARSWAPTTGPLGDKISAFLSKEAERG